MTTVYSLVAYVLTGDRLSIQHATDPTSLVSELTEAGWPGRRIEEFAQSRQTHQALWPLPVSREDLGEISPAMWYATLLEVRSLLGLTVVHLPPSRRRDLNESEQRLLKDLPPHHGRFG